jgi:serine/threonine protein kinase
MASRETEIKLINEGTFGCIFYPGLTCSGKPLKGNFVTKIQKDADTVKNEIYISRIIQKKINGYLKHFASIVNQCHVKINKSYVKEVKQCKVFEQMTNHEIEKSKYVANKIRYVGSTNLTKYLKTQVDAKSNWREVYKTHVYLLKSLQKLVDAKIVHFDIKYNNILFDKIIHAPIIIDFGLSFYLPDLHKNPSLNRHIFYTYNTYTYWCIDVFICNYIFQVITYERSKDTHITQDELNKLYRAYIYGTDDQSTNIENYVFQLSDIEDHQLNFERQYKEYTQPFVGKSWWYLYRHLIQYFNTWDNYALSVVYLIMLDEWKSENLDRYNAFIKRERESNYVHMLQRIVYSMPDKRPGIEETIARLDPSQKKSG